MADDNATTGSSKGSKKAAPAEKEVKFPRERLVAEAQELLGVRPRTVAGALVDVRGEGDLTLDDATAAVERYRKRSQKTKEA